MNTMYIVSETEKMGFWYDGFPKHDSLDCVHTQLTTYQ